MRQYRVVPVPSILAPAAILVVLLAGVTFFLCACIYTHKDVVVQMVDKIIYRTKEVRVMVFTKEPKVTKASWYGEPFHGRTTACGQRYNMHAISVAHVNLPCGTIVEFKNRANGKALTAYVTDRGPYDPTKLPKLVPHPERGFDFSRGAAKVLDFIEDGIVEIEYTILD